MKNKKKPTIKELEKILDNPNSHKTQIQPDGSLKTTKARPSKTKLKEHFEEKYLKNTCFESLEELLKDKTDFRVNIWRSLIAVELKGVWRGLNDPEVHRDCYPVKLEKCLFPDCGCPEARLCLAGNPNEIALSLNLPRRKGKK